MKHIEPFNHYAKIGRGVPWLSLSIKGKHGFVSWGGGTLNDERLFQAALSPELRIMLKQLWDEHESELSKRAELFRGGDKASGGAVSYIPTHIAFRFHSLVLLHFERALGLMLDSGVSSSPLLWDDISLIQTRINSVMEYQ